MIAINSISSTIIITTAREKRRRRGARNRFDFGDRLFVNKPRLLLLFLFLAELRRRLRGQTAAIRYECRVIVVARFRVIICCHCQRANRYRCDEQNRPSPMVGYSSRCFHNCLCRCFGCAIRLPVWECSYFIDDQEFTVFVNAQVWVIFFFLFRCLFLILQIFGQTGKLWGERVRRTLAFA